MTDVMSGTNVIPRTEFVWISPWEYQCCGTPISRGSTIELTLEEFVPNAWLPATDHFPGGRGPFRLSATHHGYAPDGHNVRVHVEQLWEVRLTTVFHPETEQWTAEPGTLEITPVPVMRPREHDWQPATRGGEPSGWVLLARVLETLPPLRDGIPYGLNAAPRLVRTDEHFPRLATRLGGTRGGSTDTPETGFGVPSAARPWLAAWQPDPPREDASGLVYGHPCLVLDATERDCEVLVVAARNGLHSPGVHMPTADLVVLPPREFLHRVGYLVSSSWRGLADQSVTGPLTDHAHLFPKGIPTYLF